MYKPLCCKKFKVEPFCAPDRPWGMYYVSDYIIIYTETHSGYRQFQLLVLIHLAYIFPSFIPRLSPSRVYVDLLTFAPIELYVQGSMLITHAQRRESLGTKLHISCMYNNYSRGPTYFLALYPGSHPRECMLIC